MPGVLQRKASLKVRMLLESINGPGAQGATMNPILNAIRSELAVLDQTWSEIATRNLVNDIARQIDRLAGVVPIKEKPIVEGAATDLRKLVKQPSPRTARYANVACFGYRKKTTGPAFSGDVDDWNDMRTRCADLIAAIRSAYALANTNGGHNADGTMLKIFMAPEFFFRGINGAYDHDVVMGVNAMNPGNGAPIIPAKQGIFDLMRAEINNNIYKDWLFVLGTAIAATRYTETVCSICNADVKWAPDPANRGKTVAVCKTNAAHAGTKERVSGARIDNVALVMKEDTTYSIAKELISHVDFTTSPSKSNVVTVRNTPLTVLRSAKPSGYMAASGLASKFTDERMGGSIFTIDGITVGLEVCLDHVATTSTGAAGRLDHAGNIQIQLIPSGGMSIAKFTTVPGGIVFNVDGATPHIQVLVTRNIATVDTIDFTHLHDANYMVTANRPLAGNPSAPQTKAIYDGLVGPWQTPAASSHAGAGSVFMFGPYPIPAV